MAHTADRPAVPHAAAVTSLLGLALAVSLALGVYAKAHDPAGRPLFTLGFSGMLQMKAWLTTIAVALLLVQLLTALWMWGRLPGARSAPTWASQVHRLTGSIAFIATVPAAVHCMWSLGFGSGSTRVLVHSIVGCAFYGAYAAKMLGLRLTGLPGWALPVMGSAVMVSLTLIWLTSALWFFTRSGLPLT